MIQQMMLLPWQNKLHSMCIGFSGSAQTGKTSMAKEISTYLDGNLIEDIIPGYLNEKKIKDINQLDDKQFIKVYMDLMIRKKAIERSFTKFVADTTILDYSTSVLVRLCNQPDFQRGAMDYIRECGQHAAEIYDVIFLLPYRNDNTPLPAKRAMNSMLCEKSVEDGQPIFVAHVVTSDTQSDRIGECLEVIDKVSTIKVQVENDRKEFKTPTTNMTQ